MSQARLRKIFHESLPVILLEKCPELDTTKLNTFINLFVGCLKSGDYSKKMIDFPFVIVLDPANQGTGNCVLKPDEITQIINNYTLGTCNVIAVDYDGIKINTLPFDDCVIVDGEDIASGLSKSYNLILFYINKLAVCVFVNGECIKSTPNIHTSKRTGQISKTDKPPSQYKELILDHFNSIDKGKSFGYWAVKKDRILKPKPEGHFRNILLSYLQDNLIPEGVAEKEIPVGNTDDEIDIRIIDFSCGEYIFIEIKWMGEARKEFKKEETTKYGEESPNDGLKQLCIYLDTESRAKNGCLLTYDARFEDKEIKWHMSDSKWHDNVDKPPMRLYLKSDSASVESKKNDNKGKKKQQGKSS